MFNKIVPSSQRILHYQYISIAVASSIFGLTGIPGMPSIRRHPTGYHAGYDFDSV